MYYCAGEYCSKRNECAHNKPDTSGKPQQWLDMSTQGSAKVGIDDWGRPVGYHEWYCGDRADNYKHFVPICRED